jgi:hypothetical protein
MKHYMVKIVDGYSDEIICLHFYGLLETLEMKNRLYQAIVNEEGLPIYIEGKNTREIVQYSIFG